MSANLSPRRRPNSSIQAIDDRLADLNERLRAAQNESQQLKGRLSPGPAARAAGTPSGAVTSPTPQAPLSIVRDSGMLSSTASKTTRPTATLNSPPMMESRERSPQRTSNFGGYVASPAGGVTASMGLSAATELAISQRRLRERADEDSAAATRQRDINSGLHDHMRSIQDRLSITNASIAAKEREARDAERRKTTALTEASRALEQSDARVDELERQATRSQRHLSELAARRAILERQLEEVRLAVRRAEARNDEVLKEQMVLERRLLEAAAATKERERAVRDEADQFAQIRQRLESRIAEIEEENNQAADRLRRLDAQHRSQELAWRDEDAQLQKETESLELHVAEQQARLVSLQSEVAEREREADIQRQIRDRRASELASERENERAADAAKARAALERRESELLQERDELLAGVRAQIQALTQQAESKRRAREAQEDVVAQLDRRLADLQQAAARKAALSEECLNLEAGVQELHARRDDLQATARQLNQTLKDKDDRLTELDRLARRLADRLDEEKRLRQHVNDIARDVNDAQIRYESERATAEQNLVDEERRRDRSRDELALLEKDIVRIREAGNAEVDLLNRKIAALRGEIAEKEAALQQATRENAQKQAAIAEFEEERRRMEREALARKAAAAHAAKAALTELSF